ncbi:MAG: hypothetical protein H7231_00825 [Rhodoferax sp.]|nr:hypothetical protein [Actinomycetota bacterium]
MIVLALIALLVAAAAVVFMIVRGTHQDVPFSFFAGNFTTNPLTIFIAGAVTLFLVLFALSLIRRGTRRKVAQRREIKRLRKVEETSVPAQDVRTSARHGRDHDLDRGDGDSSDVNRSDVNRSDVDRSDEVDLSRGDDTRHGRGSDANLNDQETLVREPRRGDDGRTV